MTGPIADELVNVKIGRKDAARITEHAETILDAWMPPGERRPPAETTEPVLRLIRAAVTLYFLEWNSPTYPRDPRSWVMPVNDYIAHGRIAFAGLEPWNVLLRAAAALVLNR